MATPALRIRIAPKFPAKIQGSGGITVTRAGGVVTIGGANIYPVATEQDAREGIDNYKRMTAATTQVAVENVPISVAARPESTSVSERFAKVISLKSDYGAKGNNTDADDAAFNAAIAEAEVGDYPIAIDLEGGVYRANAALTTITKPIQFISRGEREAVITFRGAGGFVFQGDNQRVANAGLRNIGIDGSAMASGYAVVVDWAQAFRLENVLMADCYSALQIRQAGGTTLSNVQIDKMRGGFGIHAVGPRGTRNGELDKIDVIDMKSVTITGTYEPGVTSPAGTGLYLDGHVHTVNYDVLRILSLNAGVFTQNTGSLAQEYVPSFLHGTSLEVENTWLEGIRLEALNEWRGAATFQSTSVSLSGIYLGAAVYDVQLFGGAPRNNWKFGIEFAGAENCSFFGLSSHRNGGAGAGFSAAYIGSGDNIGFYGGKLGKNTAVTGYSETQSYGIDNVSGTNVRAIGVDLRDNAVAAINGSVLAVDCLGADVSPVNGSVGASPYVRTAGARPEVWSVYGGTGVVVKRGGVIIQNTTPATMYLPPGVEGRIEHSGTPPTVDIITL